MIFIISIVFMVLMILTVNQCTKMLLQKTSIPLSVIGAFYILILNCMIPMICVALQLTF